VSLAVNKRYDAIIYLGNAYYISTWLSCLIAKLMGKKIIMWTHGVRKEENGLKGWIRKSFYKLADEMLLYGHHARNIMIDMGLNPDRLTVIYNSLDYDRQVSIRKSISNIELEDKRRTLFQKSELVVLLFIGRLTKSKKLDMILEASFLMKSDGFETNVLIIGDGEERQHLEELVRKYGLENNVVFWGACHNENELAPLIMLADICVSPGNVGLTCMHSLVYGTPVITHDDPTEQMPEFEAVRPYSTGLFFKKDSVQDLVKSIYDWLNYASRNPNILKSCHKVIDDFYNPYYQIRIIEKSVLDICH
jgi:glycosyltransferase involved in cell wall biosynthesis